MPGVDVRISATDKIEDLRGEGIDLAIRYCAKESAAGGAQRLFGETVAPVASSGPLASIRCNGAARSSGNVDAVAHQIAVALLHHVAEMYADTEVDAALRRQAGVALDHRILHFDPWKDFRDQYARARARGRRRRQDEDCGRLAAWAGLDLGDDIAGEVLRWRQARNVSTARVILF